MKKNIIMLMLVGLFLTGCVNTKELLDDVSSETYAPIRRDYFGMLKEASLASFLINSQNELQLCIPYIIYANRCKNIKTVYVFLKNNVIFEYSKRLYSNIQIHTVLNNVEAQLILWEDRKNNLGYTKVHLPWEIDYSAIKVFLNIMVEEGEIPQSEYNYWKQKLIEALK